MRLARWLIVVGFAAVALLFALLPFVAVRAAQPQQFSIAFSWNGSVLVAGGHGNLHVEEPLWDEKQGADVMTDVSDFFQQEFGSGTSLPPQHAFMGAAFLIIAGLAGAILLTAASRRWVIAVAGIGGAVALVVAELRVINLLNHGKLANIGPPEPAYGFWVVGGLLLLLGIAGIVLVARGEPTPAPTPPRPEPQPAPVEAG